MVKISLLLVGYGGEEKYPQVLRLHVFRRFARVRQKAASRQQVSSTLITRWRCDLYVTPDHYYSGVDFNGVPLHRAAQILSRITDIRGTGIRLGYRDVI